MAGMTSRERVLRTFRFQETDRAPYDLMESVVWPDLQKWYAENMGLADKDNVANHFDLDFRWFWAQMTPPEGISIYDSKYCAPYTGNYSDYIQRPLADVQTVSELLRRREWADPTWWNLKPVHQLREQHPDKAIVMIMFWMHPFMLACDSFGLEETLVRLQTDDEVMLSFLKRHNEFCVESLKFAGREANGDVDICWLMDDIASQQSLMMNPITWRRHFKPLLRRQVEVLHEHNILALFHCCGALRAILPDLIDIGMDGVLPFQTTAEGMEVESIARDFGGKIAFYGGIDIQQLLTFGTEEEVRAEVRRNIDAFSQCGGYTVANSHHGISNINPCNLNAMLDEARHYQLAR